MRVFCNERRNKGGKEVNKAFYLINIFWNAGGGGELAETLVLLVCLWELVTNGRANEHIKRYRRRDDLTFLLQILKLHTCILYIPRSHFSMPAACQMILSLSSSTFRCSGSTFSLNTSFKGTLACDFYIFLFSPLKPACD
jgi:hypothetical protein